VGLSLCLALYRWISLDISVEIDCEESYLTEPLLVLLYNCLYRNICFDILVYCIYCVPIVVILPFECVVVGRPFGRILVYVMIMSLYSTVSQTSKRSVTFGNCDVEPATAVSGAGRSPCREVPGTRCLKIDARCHGWTIADSVRPEFHCLVFASTWPLEDETHVVDLLCCPSRWTIYMRWSGHAERYMKTYITQTTSLWVGGLEEAWGSARRRWTAHSRQQRTVNAGERQSTTLPWRNRK